MRQDGQIKFLWCHIWTVSGMKDADIARQLLQQVCIMENGNCLTAIMGDGRIKLCCFVKQSTQDSAATTPTINTWDWNAGYNLNYCCKNVLQWTLHFSEIGWGKRKCCFHHWPQRQHLTKKVVFLSFVWHEYILNRPNNLLPLVYTVIADEPPAYSLSH